MILNWIVILGIIITQAQLITLSNRSLCSCNQLLDEISCLSAVAICTWSNNICIDKKCSEISIQNCPQTYGCYLSGGQICNEFVECHLLSGNSIFDCFSQNNQCSWTSDSNCVPLNQVTCEEVTEIKYCTQSGTTLCYWSEEQCNSMKICSDQTKEYDCVNNALKACQWDSVNQICIDNQCSLQSGDQCGSFLLSPINTNQFQICKLDSEVCSEANPADLSQESCYTNTKGTFFWDIEVKLCKSCASAKTIVETIESTCRCSQILSEDDCNQSCRWMDTYCKDRWCKDNLTQKDCEQDSNCFYQDDLCQVFKGCNDLKQELCESDTYTESCTWDKDCQPVEEPAPIICINITDPEQCNSEVETNSGKYCIWISDEQCKGAVVSTCSGVNDVDENNIEGLCGRLTDQCFYNVDEGTCGQLICDDYQDAESCSDHQWTIVDESGNLNLCSWNGTHCISGIDIEQFDQTNCYSAQTRFQLTFDATSQKCTKCPGIGGRKDYLPDHLEVQKSICSTPILSEQEQFEPQITQPLQFLYISPNLITPLWPPIKEKLLQLTNMSNVTPYQLYQQIEDIYLLHFQAKNLKNKINFNNLQEAISNFEFKKDLLQKAIPHFAKLALRLESEFRDYIPMLTETFTFTHEQCAILIANMFFCTLHLQPDFKHLPSTFICAKLFNHNNDDNSLKIQKIRCFLYYIMHVFENKNNAGNVIFTRQRREFNLIDMKLCEFIYCENGNMEQVEDAYIVDFANKRIGGGVLAAGCVQEEILFLVHPEAMVSVLLTTEIQGDEAILIEGVERIIEYSGYKNTFRCDGLVKKRKFINFICIDAQDYATNRHQQYNDYMSQIVKAYTGFYGKQKICTGRWGCGVFGGEWQLKTLIQWLAASCCDCKQLIFVNDQNYIYNQAFQLIGNMSTHQLMKYIKEYCQLKVNNAIDQKVEAIDYILLSNNN